MTIANKTVTTSNQSITDPSWTHTPVGGDPNGVLVIISQWLSSPAITAVTYGGVAMTEVPLSPHIKSTGETMYLSAWFLGTGIPTGAQTVAVTGNARNRAMASYTVTAAGDMVVQDTDADILSDSLANPSAALSLGGNSSFCVMTYGAGRTITSPLTNWTADIDVNFGSQNGGCHSYDIIGSTDVTIGWNQATADDVAAIGVAIKEDVVLPSVDDINTDEIVLDAETGVTFTTTGYTGEITTAKLVSGTAETDASNIASTSGAGTFDLPDVSGYIIDTVGAPFTSTSNAVVATLGDGTDTASLAITNNPIAGWAVTEVTSAVKVVGSYFENVIEAVPDTSLIYAPTTVSFTSTGILTTDETSDIETQWWNATTNTWRQVTILITPDVAGEGKTINDSAANYFINASIARGQINQMELLWLQSLGATSASLTGAWMEYLVSLGYTSGSIQDRQMKWLKGLGHDRGNINSSFLSFWSS